MDTIVMNSAKSETSDPHVCEDYSIFLIEQT